MDAVQTKLVKQPGMLPGTYSVLARHAEWHEWTFIGYVEKITPGVWSALPVHFVFGVDKSHASETRRDGVNWLIDQWHERLDTSTETH